MEHQQTISARVDCRGIGLHTGARVGLTLRPAPPDHGIVFVAGAGRVRIPVRPESLVNGHYATTIGASGVELQTVEHLLAAVRGLSIDNLLVEVDGPELPAMDGSAAPFVSLLADAGVVAQAARRRPVLRVSEPVRVGDESRWIQISPGPDFRVSFTLDHDHPAVGVQVASVTVTPDRFVAEIASARTYGFLSDLELLRRQGLALGGSLDNAVVVGRDRVLNGALRFPDEFVRHKILDVIGDLALLGRPVLGHVVARNAGHALNHRLVRQLAPQVAVPSPALGRLLPGSLRDAEPARPRPAFLTR